MSGMKSRRSFLAAAMTAALTPGQTRAQEAAQRTVRATPSPRIKDVQVIATAPAGSRLTVVKILTDQDGLYGYGCATFTQRAEAVNTAIEKYLRPFLLGKPTDRIDDLWQAMYNSSYWRNGPVLNNAISGVDQALWDIKGRQAGMPVYQLLGGKCREAADLYTGVGGADNAQLIENIRKAKAAGYRHFRLNLGEGGGDGGATTETRGPEVLHSAPLWDRESYLRNLLKMLEAV